MKTLFVLLSVFILKGCVAQESEFLKSFIVDLVEKNIEQVLKANEEILRNFSDETFRSVKIIMENSTILREEIKSKVWSEVKDTIENVTAIYAGAKRIADGKKINVKECLVLMNEVFKNGATIQNEALECIEAKSKGIEYVYVDIVNVTQSAWNGTLVLKKEAEKCTISTTSHILDESTEVVCLEKVKNRLLTERFVKLPITKLRVKARLMALEYMKNKLVVCGKDWHVHKFIEGANNTGGGVKICIENKLH